MDNGENATKDLAAWRENRDPGWTKDPGYLAQNELDRHSYLLSDKGTKPDDPGWHTCRCGGWEGYWTQFHPHVADHIRSALLSATVAGPRQLAAMAEMDGTVIKDASGTVLVADGDCWLEPGSGTLDPELPVTILHRNPQTSP